MSNQHACHRRLTHAAGLLLLTFAASAGAAVPDLLASTAASAGAAASESACGSDDARALAGAPQDLCRSGTPSAVSGTGPWSWTCSEGRQKTHCGSNAAAHFNYQAFDYPDATRTIFWGINDFGDIAGEYRIGGTISHAVLFRNGRFEPLDPDGLFGDRYSAAGGPNDFGTVIGYYTDASATPAQHGFVMRWGQVETVDIPGHLDVNLNGVNLFGAVVGMYWDADHLFHGFERSFGHDTFIDVPGAFGTVPIAIGDKGDIVGAWYVNDFKHLRGFYRSPKGELSMIDVPIAGPVGTNPYGINNAGQIVGCYADAAGVFHGFIRQKNGQFQYFDVPGAVSTFPTSINNFGVIAGEYHDASNLVHAFVATPW
jgi:uncharacterized membrane protein